MDFYILSWLTKLKQNKIYFILITVIFLTVCKSATGAIPKQTSRLAWVCPRVDGCLARNSKKNCYRNENPTLPRLQRSL